MLQTFIVLIVKAVRMSETSVYLNKSTPRYISEGSLLLAVSTDMKFVRPLLLASFFIV
jgi:hypothetical protein